MPRWSWKNSDLVTTTNSTQEEMVRYKPYTMPAHHARPQESA